MKTRGYSAKVRRKQLDRIFLTAKKLVTAAPPRGGWIGEIRECLGMTFSQFAKRMAVAPSVAKRFEESEVKRTITLASLDKAASALNCRVVYFLIPSTSLDESVLKQAHIKASQLRKPVAHSMKLEDQSTDPESLNDRNKLFAEELISKLDRSLWDEDD